MTEFAHLIYGTDTETVNDLTNQVAKSLCRKDLYVNAIIH